MDIDEIGRPAEFLLVEDNPGDVRLTQEALRECKLRNNLSVVGDGVEALAFLRREGKYQDAPRPDVILLDLNLPKKGGHEVLAEIKADPVLRRIPVVIISRKGCPGQLRPARQLLCEQAGRSRSVHQGGAIRWYLLADHRQVAG